MNTHTITIQIPGNLILFGEYYITEPFSTALCMAPNIYATLRVTLVIGTNRTGNDSRGKVSKSNSRRVGRDINLSSNFNNQNHTFKTANECTIYQHALNIFAEYKDSFLLQQGTLSDNNNLYAENLQTNDWQAKLHAFFDALDTGSISACIDTNNFFICHKKMGLGSSEVATVLCCCLVLLCNKINPLLDRALLAEFATKTHYVWQGNKGSGYGVYTSIYGGLGYYHNCLPPTFTPIKMNNMYWYFAVGNSNTLSSRAISEFLEFKKNKPDTYLFYKQQYMQHILALQHMQSDAERVEKFYEWLGTAKDLGLALGNELSLSADVIGYCVENNQHIIWKATGAGNENAVGYSAVKPTHKISNNNIIKINPSQGIEWVQKKY